MPPEPAYLQFDQAIARALQSELLKSSVVSKSGQPYILSVPAGQTIQQALEALELHLPQAAVALINGGVSDLNYILQPGDTVRLLSQISGG